MTIESGQSRYVCTVASEASSQPEQAALGLAATAKIQEPLVERDLAAEMPLAVFHDHETPNLPLRATTHSRGFTCAGQKRQYNGQNVFSRMVASIVSLDFFL